MADAVQTGAPIVGGASLSALTFMCMQCMMATAGAAFIGKDIGGAIGNKVANVIRGPEQPATPAPSVPAPAPMASMPGMDMPGM